MSHSVADATATSVLALALVVSGAPKGFAYERHIEDENPRLLPGSLEQRWSSRGVRAGGGMAGERICSSAYLKSNGRRSKGWKIWMKVRSVDAMRSLLSFAARRAPTRHRWRGVQPGPSGVCAARPDEPPPVFEIGPRTIDFVIVVDHAGRRIPAAIDDLGFPVELQRQHCLGIGALAWAAGGGGARCAAGGPELFAAGDRLHPSKVARSIPR